jgi:hypothetical protein
MTARSAEPHERAAIDVPDNAIYATPGFPFSRCDAEKGSGNRRVTQSIVLAMKCSASFSVLLRRNTPRPDDSR